MSNCPILALPDFSMPFVIECDASGEGIGVALKKGQHPIAFEIKNLQLREKCYSIYDKEILAIMHALAKFRQYLVGNKFVVKIDHNSIRDFLTQKDLNEREKKWARKIKYYDIDIEYVKGKNKIVADALSQRLSFSLMTLLKIGKTCY